jgi:uncharacterized protein YgiM (DUF1202 family)
VPIDRLFGFLPALLIEICRIGHRPEGEVIMKKMLFTFIAAIFLFTSTSVAFAGYYGHGGYRPRPYYHHGHSGDWVGALGIGLLTGTLLTSMFYATTPHPVVYQTTEPVVVASPPVVVRERTYTTVPQNITPSRVSVTTAELNVRSGPGMDHSVAGFVRRGEVLDVMGSAPGWLYVKTIDGLYGWVMVQFTAAEPMG